jgi:hypothetical protein
VVGLRGNLPYTYYLSVGTVFSPVSCLISGATRADEIAPLKARRKPHSNPPQLMAILPALFFSIRPLCFKPAGRNHKEI